MNTKKKRTTPPPPHNLNAKIVKKPRYTKSKAVKSLENMDNEAARKKYPMIPSECLVPFKYQLSIERARGVYIIATSFEQFYKWFTTNYGRGNHGK